jgi:hypothetical protein
MDKNSIDKFEEIVGRAERFEEVFSQRMDSVATSEQVVIKIRKELALEIEELRKARHALEGNLTKIIEEATKENIHSTMANIMPRLIGEFIERTEEATNASLQKASKLIDSIDAVIHKTCQLMKAQQNSLTWRRVWFMVSFCFASLLTAFGINYLYPTHINYQMNPSMARSFLLGEATYDIYKDLTRQQKDKLLEALDKKCVAGIGKAQGLENQ